MGSSWPAFFGEDADQGFEDVVDGDDALDGAVFVEHDAGVDAGGLEEFEDLEAGRALVEKQGHDEDAAEVERLASEALDEEVLDLDDAEDDVERAFADGEAGVGAGGDLAADFGGRVVQVDPDDLGCGGSSARLRSGRPA